MYSHWISNRTFDMPCIAIGPEEEEEGNEAQFLLWFYSGTTKVRAKNIATKATQNKQSIFWFSDRFRTMFGRFWILFFFQVLSFKSYRNHTQVTILTLMHITNVFLRVQTMQNDSIIINLWSTRTHFITFLFPFVGRIFSSYLQSFMQMARNFCNTVVIT